MKSTVLCLALAVVGWMVFGNSRIAFAQEGSEHRHQALRRRLRKRHREPLVHRGRRDPVDD